MTTEPLRLRDLIEQLQALAERYGDDLRVTFNRRFVEAGRNVAYRDTQGYRTAELELPLQ